MGVHAGISLKGSLTREFRVEPGQKYEGEIRVTNTGKDPTGVKIYKRDYLFFADGTNRYKKPGKVDRSNAPWVSLSSFPASVDPGETVSVNYEIKVPDNQGLAGTYWSLIMAAPKSPPSSKKQGDIGIRMRYGVQVVTNIGDSGKRELKVAEAKLLKGKDKVPTLQIDLKNTGERWLTPQVSLRVYDQQGQLLGPFKSPTKRLYPGTSVRHKIKLGKLSSGDYKAVAIFDNGDEYVWGAQYTLEIS